MNPSVPEERFSCGLVALLSCLHSLCKYTSSKLASKEIASASGSQSITKLLGGPLCQMLDENINGISIRYPSTDLASWTKALKYFLTNLQWLVFASTYL